MSPVHGTSVTKTSVPVPRPAGQAQPSWASGRRRQVDAGRDDAERGAPAAGPGSLAVEQRVLLADQEALRGGGQSVAVPLQQPADARAGVAGERGDAGEPGVEGGRQGGPAVEALEPVP